jgi:hypothetical protein
MTRLASRWLQGRIPHGKRDTPHPDLETAYCAEIVAITYAAMGLLPHGHRPNWYDAGRFWSGDHLSLATEATLGKEIEVDVPE